MKASIIIVNYNGKSFLKECLDSVFSQAVEDFEIIFVDNNSSDNSIEFIKSEYPQYIGSRLRIIASGSNLGFAGGNNLGYEHSTGDYIVLLNNDTAVSEGWLQNLISALETLPGAGIVQSLVLTEGIPEKYYKENGTINLLGHNIMNVFPINDNAIGEIFQANGCSLITDRSFIEASGGLFLDEYFAYSEDTFLCFKAKFMNKKIYHNSNSVVHHKGGSTSKKQRPSAIYFYQERNRLLNFLLFFSGGFIIKYIPFLVFNFSMKFFYCLFSRSYSLKGLFKAYFWILFHLSWIKSQRSNLQSIKQVSEASILPCISGKLFNGKKAVLKVFNFLGILYCRAVNINVIETGK